MTETMKKFKPPFRYEELHIGIYDADDNLVTMAIDESSFSLPESGKLIAEALNLYYAKRGEKE